jgi:hypothetical protein
MNMKIILLTLAVVFSGTMPLLARSSALAKPSFASPTSCPTQVVIQVSDALNRPDCKFIGGQLASRSTHLRYSGDTKALNGMLADLAKCPGVVFTIQFTDNFIESGDWSVSSQPGSNQFIFQVLVNLQSERIKLDELRVPEMKGPAPKSTTTAAANPTQI